MPDVKIKGWSGTEFSYQNVPKIWLNAPESTEESPVLVPYTYGEAVSKTVEPDFSGGDMALDIPDGELVKELTITKPETLIPKNIASGVTVAGIAGTHDGGGGGSGVVFCAHPFYGKKRISTSPYTYEVKFYVSIPKDAQLISCSFKSGYNYYDTSFKNYTLDDRNYVCNPADFYTESEENGYKKVCVTSDIVTISATSVYTLFASPQGGASLYIQNSMILPGGRLEATSLCQGFEGYHDGIYASYSYGQYIEEIDLRGSAITTLLRGTLTYRPGLKKIWLPEVLTNMSNSGVLMYNGTNMEELHFTSENPPTINSSTFSSSNGLPKTCKIYVPAGKLDVYNNAISYLNNYTCIEE